MHTNKNEISDQKVNDSKQKHSIQTRLPCWIEMAKQPQTIHDERLTKIDASHFMGSGTDSFIIFNTTTDEWSELTPNADQKDLVFPCGVSNNCYDPISKQIFIINYDLVIFDVGNNKLIGNYPHKDGIDMRYYSNSICIDGVCHIIGGYDRVGLATEGEIMETNLHQIWNNQAKELEIIHRFNEYPNGISRFELVHIPKRGEVLLLGGVLF